MTPRKRRTFSDGPPKWTYTALGMLLAVVAAPISGEVCRPVRCSWAAPGFSPSTQVSEVWVLPCPAFAAAAPTTTGTYPVTLTITCTYHPSTSSTVTHSVSVVGGFRDGFEGGSTAAWNWRSP